MRAITNAIAVSARMNAVSVSMPPRYRGQLSRRVSARRFGASSLIGSRPRQRLLERPLVRDVRERDHDIPWLHLRVAVHRDGLVAPHDRDDQTVDRQLERCHFLVAYDAAIGRQLDLHDRHIALAERHDRSDVADSRLFLDQSRDDRRGRDGLDAKGQEDVLVLWVVDPRDSARHAERDLRELASDQIVVVIAGGGYEDVGPAYARVVLVDRVASIAEDDQRLARQFVHELAGDVLALLDDRD